MSNNPSYIFVPYAATLLALLGFAAWRDMATRTIPDTVSIALIVVGAAARFGQGWAALGVSALVGVAVFIALIPLCSRGLLGGADLKLLASLAVGLPPQASVYLIACVTMAGGVLALLYLGLKTMMPLLKTSVRPHTRSDSLLARIASIEFWRIRRGAPLPYGLAIAIGAGIVVFNQQGV